MLSYCSAFYGVEIHLKHSKQTNIKSLKLKSYISVLKYKQYFETKNLHWLNYSKEKVTYQLISIDVAGRPLGRAS